MKRFIYCFILLFFGFVFLVSCQSKQKSDLKVLMPSGAPSLAQAYLEKKGTKLSDSTSYSVERVGQATLLASGFSSEAYDIIYAPVNLGAKFYNNKGNYLYAATITWGNLYLATTGKADFTLNDLHNQIVYFFGQGSINELVLKTILEANEVTPKEIIWESGTDITKTKLIAESTNLVLIAEPSLSAAKAKLKEKSIEVNTLDVQELWNNYSGNGSYPQAGVFVKKTTFENNKKALALYLNALKEAVEYANDNPALVSDIATELEYGLPASPILKNAIPNCHLEYKTALDSKEQFNKVANLNLSLFGGKQLNEEFFAF